MTLKAAFLILKYLTKLVSYLDFIPIQSVKKGLVERIPYTDLSLEP
jgi:hypothetical protein